jgi:hypothetical protein
MIRVGGILLQDVLDLGSKVFVDGGHDPERSGELGLTVGDEISALTIAVAGAKFTHDIVGGPAVTRYVLYGRRWRIWVELHNGQLSPRDPENIEPTLLRKARGFYRLSDYDFQGNPWDFERDMTIGRMAGLV